MPIIGLDWNSLLRLRAPHIPKGSSKMKRMLTELQSTPTDHSRYPELISAITANFDQFHENQNSMNIFTKPNSNTNTTTTGTTSSNNKNSPKNNISEQNRNQSECATKSEADAAFLNYTYKRKPVSSYSVYFVCAFIYCSIVYIKYICMYLYNHHYTVYLYNICVYSSI